MSSELKPVTRHLAELECARRIAEAFEQRDVPVLVDALPAMGKSSGVVKWAAETGNPVTVFTARHELYDQYIDWAAEEGMDLDRVKRLPSFHKDCPTANGHHDDERSWGKDVRRLYREGLSGKKIHRIASERFGESLPCESSGQCPYIEQRRYEPKDYDLLVGHYTHGSTFRPVVGRYVVFDEFPEDDFLNELDSSQVNKALTQFLSSGSTRLPYRNSKEFKQAASDPTGFNPILEQIVDMEIPVEIGVHYGQYERNLPAYRFVSILIHLFTYGEELGNGWDYIDLGQGQKAVQSPDEEVTILLPPFLDYAKSVIALDGTPTVEKWRLLLGDNLDHQPVLRGKNPQRYIGKGLGLRLIQTSNHIKPYRSRNKNRISVEEDLALLEAITKREGQPPYLISSHLAIQLYEENGLEEILGITEDMSEHYGNLKGTNKFDFARLGVVIGSPAPKDEVIQKWAALLGVSAEPKEDEDGNRIGGWNLDYGQVGNRLLQGFRDNEVLQAAMRFGRRDSEGRRGATVYVHTGVLPRWVEPEKDIVSIRTWDSGTKNGLRLVIEAIPHLETEADEWKSSDLKAKIDELNDDGLTVQQVRTHLNSLYDWGYLDYRRGEGKGRPKLWRNVALDETGMFGHVVFGNNTK